MQTGNKNKKPRKKTLYQKIIEKEIPEDRKTILKARAQTIIKTISMKDPISKRKNQKLLKQIILFCSKNYNKVSSNFFSIIISFNIKLEDIKVDNRLVSNKKSTDYIINLMKENVRHGYMNADQLMTVLNKKCKIKRGSY